MRAAELFERVERMLGAKGAYASLVPGWRDNSEQREYARRVCTLLAERNAPSVDHRAALATLEASTGIGKSIGYLTPLMIYAQATGRRVAVATYTLDLLRALETTVLPLVARAIELESGEPAPRFAVRVGMREFVSHQRCQALLDTLADQDPAKAPLRALCAFADGANAGTTTGRFRDWLEAGYRLPQGVSVDAICLRPWVDVDDHAAYRRQNERAGDADLLLTTQSTILMHCIKRIDVLGASEDFPAVDAVVIDEADAVAGMAESVSQAYVPLHLLQRQLALHDTGKRKAIAAARADLERAIEHLAGNCSASGRALANQRSETHLAQGYRLGMAAAHAGIKALSALQEVKSQPEQLARLDYWRRDLSGIERVFDGHGTGSSAYVDKTPVRGLVGIGVASVDPGRVLGALWRRHVDEGGVRAVLMTSATLVPPGERGMAYFHREVGIDISQHRFIAGASGQIEPQQYGTMRFVFADPRGAKPFTPGIGDAGDVEPQFNADWVRYAATVMAAAQRNGGRTLVLTGSYRDVDVLADAARQAGMDVIEGRRGAKEEQITAFLQAPQSIWITPACWEGLDLPGAIQNLVIARLPYENPSTGTSSVVREIFKARGHGDSMARSLMTFRRKGAASRKLRQGLGRPIRGPQDDATVWFADPRFPLPARTRDALVRALHQPIPQQADIGLLNAIPARFRNGPHRALLIDGAIWSPA